MMTKRTKEKLIGFHCFFLVFMFGTSLLGGVIMVIDSFSAESSPSNGRPNARAPQFSFCKSALTNIYEEHNKAKLDSVDSLCRKYAGKERALVRQVQLKYEGADE